MADLRDIIAYYCKKYPHKTELSKARLTKMVYLADWKSCIDRSKQISKIQWVYNHYGPYVEDVANVAQTDDIFDLKSTINFLGKSKQVVKLKSENYDTKSLSVADKNILDHIISITSKRYWNSFIELVYSTYPIIKSEKFSNLNLVELAEEYKQNKPE